MRKLNLAFLKKREILVAGVILLIMIVMTCTTKTFLTVNNLMSVALGLSADGFLALAMTFILISGQIDLSLGAIQCFASMLIGTLYIYKGVNIWLAVLISVIVSVVCGAITGSLIAKLNIVPFIITLGMQGVVRGLCYVVSSGISIPITGESVRGFKNLGSGYLGSVPIFFILLIAAAIICLPDPPFQDPILCQGLFHRQQHQSRRNGGCAGRAGQDHAVYDLRPAGRHCRCALHRPFRCFLPHAGLAG